MATIVALSGILFAGDSDIEGWATAAEFPKSVNVGVGGATCGDVAKKAEGYISTYSPREVVLVRAVGRFGPRAGVDVVVEHLGHAAFGALAQFLDGGEMGHVGTAGRLE